MMLLAYMNDFDADSTAASAAALTVQLVGQAILVMTHTLQDD